MFLYIKLAQQSTSTIDIIFKPFVKRDNSSLGNPICKTVSVFYGEIDEKIVWIDKLHSYKTTTYIVIPREIDHVL